MKCKTLAVSMTNSHLLNTGLGEFEKSIGIRLADKASMLLDKYGIKLLFLVDKEMVGAFGDNVDYYVINKVRRELLKNCLFTPLRRWLLPSVDMVHWTNQFYKFRVRIAPKLLVTVHDFNFMHNEITGLHKRKKLMVTTRRLDQATHLSFISNFTEQDVKCYYDFKQPARVICNGVTNLNTKTQDQYDKELEGMGVPKTFLFHISRWSRKKNVILILEMMKHLPDEHLVLAGTAGEKFEKLVYDTIESLQLKNVTVVGKVSGEQKAALLSRCKGLLFPSMSEGFGLPVVEAMCFGKPSFLTRLTSLPEVGGDISYYFDSLDAKDMAETVCKGLADYASAPQEKAEKLKQRAAMFSWDRAVDEYVQFYIDILCGKEK